MSAVALIEVPALPASPTSLSSSVSQVAASLATTLANIDIALLCFDTSVPDSFLVNNALFEDHFFPLVVNDDFCNRHVALGKLSWPKQAVKIISLLCF